MTFSLQIFPIFPYSLFTLSLLQFHLESDTDTLIFFILPENMALWEDLMSNVPRYELVFYGI